jgi:cation:H+ antiporter
VPDLTTLSLWPAVFTIGGAALVIVFVGTRLAGVADRLADRTGMGEILAGAIFVGGSTSLPGAVASMTTAADGHAQLAIGNAIGGLTAQTMFLAIADLVYRRANIEHAAATVTGLTQGVLLVSLMCISLIAGHGPDVTVWHVHPATVVLIVSYGFGLRLLSHVKDEPMWSPVQTSETRQQVEEPTEGKGEPTTSRLWGEFAIYAAATAAAGYAVASGSEALIEATPLSEAAIGTLITGVANSLPELVTAIAAVRRGAVNLAVGDIIGGNSFEVLFLAAADVFYREGSLYHAFTTDNIFTALVAMLMTGVLLLGLLRRKRHGLAGIGFESVLVLFLYAASAAILLT